MAQKVEKLKAASKEVAPKLKKVLDAEQYAKWEKNSAQFLEELQQRFQGRKQN